MVSYYKGKTLQKYSKRMSRALKEDRDASDYVYFGLIEENGIITDEELMNKIL